MASCAIAVRAELLRVAAVMVFRRGLTGFGGAVTVLMVPEMVGTRPGLVLAIAGHRSPGHLEREPNQQEDTQEASHGEAVYGGSE